MPDAGAQATRMAFISGPVFEVSVGAAGCLRGGHRLAFNRSIEGVVGFGRQHQVGLIIVPAEALSAIRLRRTPESVQADPYRKLKYRFVLYLAFEAVYLPGQIVFSGFIATIPQVLAKGRREARTSIDVRLCNLQAIPFAFY